MLLLVGLGNPGEKYAGNRHNIGFMAIDAIADAQSLGPFRSKFEALTCHGRIETNGAPAKVALLKPQTFMNESGRAVAQAVQFYKLTAQDVLVFYDELDLAPGKFRLKSGGGAAGHNGIKSIIAAIGPDFRRARIGIGHPGDRSRVLSHVLSDFAKSEREWVDVLCDAIGRSADLLAAGREDQFQTRVTHLAPAPKPSAHSPIEGERG